MGAKKEPTTKEYLTELDIKINKRPTIYQVLSLMLAVGAIGMGILYFMLGNQTSTIKAETTATVTTAISTYQDNEYARWPNRKKSIIDEVLAKLKLMGK
jgi:hypothetical protein